MAEKLSQAPPLSRRSIVYLLLCLAGVLVFALFGLLPGHLHLRRLDSAVAARNELLKKQEILVKQAEDLEALARALDESLEALPVASPLERSQKDGAAGILAGLAERSGLKAKVVAENMVDLPGGSFLPLTVDAHGEFSGFRSFLSELSALAFFVKLEEMTLQVEPDPAQYHMKVWLQVSP